MVKTINFERWVGIGPFRFDDSRNDRRFYLNHDIAYFRQGDLITPLYQRVLYGLGSRGGLPHHHGVGHHQPAHGCAAPRNVIV